MYLPLILQDSFSELSHKSHNASNIPQCIFCNIYAHMCTLLLQNGALWDMDLVHCGICATGLLSSLVLSEAITWTNTGQVTWLHMGLPSHNELKAVAGKTGWKDTLSYLRHSFIPDKVTFGQIWKETNEYQRSYRADTIPEIQAEKKTNNGIPWQSGLIPWLLMSWLLESPGHSLTTSVWTMQD